MKPQWRKASMSSRSCRQMNSTMERMVQRMTVQSNIYNRILARHYDEGDGAEQDQVDLDFYVDLARKIGGPVLELACGTGRVLLPIARQGIAIHGRSEEHTSELQS